MNHRRALTTSCTRRPYGTFECQRREEPHEAAPPCSRTCFSTSRQTLALLCKVFARFFPLHPGASNRDGARDCKRRCAWLSQDLCYFVQCLIIFRKLNLRTREVKTIYLSMLNDFVILIKVLIKQESITNLSFMFLKFHANISLATLRLVDNHVLSRRTL